ncbi:TonB-dependent receptor [candidate division KSB1 bacterium]|nr:TonB-dependent receptor [candidate division KSB1 bacterium]
MSHSKDFVYILALILTCTGVFAQTTGKIAGVVTDKVSGDPLPGTNIIIEGTLKGAAANNEGRFFIINVPPGRYNIEATMMGYSKVTVQNVRVSVNSTSNLMIEMDTEVIEGESVVVTADAITIKKDQTSSIRTIATDELEKLPVENLNHVINMQAGVVGGHFRGGRSTEVTYLIDGMSVDNAFSGDYKSTEVDVEVVQELEVITGTFNAEYGNAMSGVVNAVTKDGTPNYSGSFSSSFANYFTGNNDIFIGLGKDDFLTRNLSQDYKVQLQGPIFKNKLFFLVNYRFQNNNGHLNGIRRFTPIDYSEYLTVDPEGWHLEGTGDGKTVSMSTSEFHNLFGKMTYNAAANIKLGALMTYNDRVSTNYNHAWKYNPDPLMNYFNSSIMGAITLNHMVSQSLFYDMKLSYNKQVLENYFYEDPTDSRYISPYYQGRGHDGFITGGMPGPGKPTDTFSSVNLKADMYWQLSQYHGIKTGFVGTIHEINRDRIDVRNTYQGTSLETEQMIDPITGKIDYPFYDLEIIPKTEETLDVYTVNPYEFSVYLQDKMEFDELVMNLGVRFDYFDPDQVYPSDRRNPGNQLNLPDSMMSTYLQSPAKNQLSPRFGLAYQLGDEAVLRFSYGHFFQMPPMHAIYQNNVFRVPTSDYDITMGNTLLDAEKTVSYEIGLWQQLSEGMSLELALYYKDIYNLLSTKIISTYNQIEYGLFTNKDYGNSRGLEVKWNYQIGGFFANLNYTLAYTKANADNPWQTFNRAGDSRDPIKRYIPMPWDQRHTINLTSGYSTKNYSFTTTAYYNSGQPYTYTPLGSSPLSLINLYTNNDMKPGAFSVDLIAYWRLPIFTHSNYDVRLTLNVYNLLDNLNANWVYGDTGKPYKTIVTDVEKSNFRSNFTDVFDQYENPTMYSTPRQVKLGLKFSF